MTRPRPDYPRNRYEYTVHVSRGIRRRFTRLADAASYAARQARDFPLVRIVILDKITKEKHELFSTRRVKETAKAMIRARDKLFGPGWPWRRGNDGDKYS